MRFIHGYTAVLQQVLNASSTPASDSLINDLAAARALAKDKPTLIDHAITELAVQGRAVDPDVAEAIRTVRVAQWIYLRHSKTRAIFLDQDAENAYAVKALTTPLDQVVDAPPFLFETGVFDYLSHYVCDGIIANPIMLGPGYQADFNAAYADIRKAGRFHAKPVA